MVQAATAMMACLPPEIIGMIAARLDWRDVGHFRLSCKAFAQLALQHLFPAGEVIVWFHRRSALKLLEIAKHPVLRGCVRSLHIEIDGMKDTGDISFDEYKLAIRHQQYHRIECAQPGWSQVQQESQARPFEQDEIEQAYRQYQQDLQYQRETLDDDGPAWLQVIGNLVNLSHVSLVASFAYHPRIPRNSPQRPHCISDGYPVCDRPDMLEYETLLLALWEQKSRLTSLRCGIIGRQRFDDDWTEMPLESLWQHMNLTHLELSIRTDCATNGDECAQALRCGQLRDAIKSMKLLEVLDVRLDQYAREEHYWGGFFEDILDREAHWPNLRSIALSTIEMDADIFVEFCSRHASSLKSLTLETINLVSSWLSLLPRLQRTLHLEQALIQGDLYGTMELDNGREYEELHLQCEPALDELRSAISRYIVHGGECPVTRETISIAT